MLFYDRIVFEGYDISERHRGFSHSFLGLGTITVLTTLYILPVLYHLEFLWLAGLPCESERETWGKRSLVEAWFGLLKFRTRLFWHRFPTKSSVQSTDRWVKTFAALHNALV